MAQVIRPALLTAGFRLVSENSLEVTDDVSIIEALGEPVKVTLGAYSNIKVGATASTPLLTVCKPPRPQSEPSCGIF